MGAPALALVVALVGAAEEPRPIAVMPLKVEVLASNEVQRLNGLVRASARDSGYEVQDEKTTTDLLEASQSLGLDCDVDAVECGVKVGQIANVRFLLLGRATGGLDGHIGLALRLVDVARGLEVRHASALLPQAPDAQEKAVQDLGAVVFAPGMTVSLRLLVEPAGAEILVDGVASGTAPILEPLTALAVGDHFVQARKPGYLPYRSRVLVGKGEAAQLQVTLAVDPSAVHTVGAVSFTPEIVTIGAGSAALVGGLVAAFIGAAQYSDWQSAVADVKSVGAEQKPALDQQDITRIADAHARAEAAADNWTGWGQATVVGGVAAATAGLIAAAVGIGWSVVTVSGMDEAPSAQSAGADGS